MTSRRALASLVLIPVLALTAAGCGETAKKAGGSPPKSGTSAAGVCHYTKSSTPAARNVSLPPSTPITTKQSRVTITTNRGPISVTLDGDKTPCTVNSFLSLAKQGYFNNTPCHRLVTTGILVLQCGDPTGKGTGGPGYTLPDELLKNDPRLMACQADTECTYPAGTLAMGESATPTGQSIPNSAGSQFFLVYGPSPLQPIYPVFGHMDAAGLAVVRAVAKHGATAPNPTTGVTAPKESVRIISVK